jgi:hypothetical protein
LSNLVFGDVVTACLDTVSHPQNRQFLGDHDDVNGHCVAGVSSGVDKFELGRMREDGLGDERLTEFDELGAGLSGDARGLIGICGWVVWPAPPRDLVGVDEGAARK